MSEFSFSIIHACAASAEKFKTRSLGKIFNFVAMIEIEWYFVWHLPAGCTARWQSLFSRR